MPGPSGGRVSSDADEPNSWAQLCEQFQDLRRSARRHGLEHRWHELLGRRRAGMADLADWEALRKQLEQLDEADCEYTGRGHQRLGDRSGDWAGWDRWTMDEQFVCPERRCSRVERSTAGPAPRCDLFGLGMRRDVG